MKYLEEWAKVEDMVATVAPYLSADEMKGFAPEVFNYETFERDIDIGVSNGHDIEFQIKLFKLLIDRIINNKKLTQQLISDIIKP